MMRWLAHGVTLAVMMSIFGCVSSPHGQLGQRENWFYAVA